MIILPFPVQASNGTNMVAGPVLCLGGEVRDTVRGIAGI